MAPGTRSELVQDTELDADVTPTHTEHFFNRRGRSGGPREVWTRQSQLGRGGFGTVWLETCQQLYRAGTPSLRAVKEIRIQAGNSNGPDYDRELEAFAKFSQPKFEPYFVRSHGWYRTDNAVFITMTYHPLGDLQQYLSYPLPEAEAGRIAEQVLEGLRHMHDNGFAHRDLKPKNILVASQGPDWRVQITDFGITKKIQDGDTSQFTMGQGTSGYMAPELIISTLKGSAYALDMWSLGSMTYYMLTNRIPIRDLRDLHRYGIGVTDSFADDYSPAVVTQNAQVFISKLLARSPQDRPSADEALSSEWMDGIHAASGSPEDVRSIREALGALNVGDGHTSSSRGGQASYAPSNTWSSIPESINTAVPAPGSNVAQVSYAPSNTWNSIPATRDRIFPPLGTALNKRIERVVVSSIPDGTTLASADGAGTVRLWDAKTGAPKHTLKGHYALVRAVTFSPDGITLASDSYDKTVQLWDAKTGALKYTLKGHDGWVHAVAFSPNGIMLASASSHDKKIRLWDAKTGALKRTLNCHGTQAIAFSPDSTTLASTSGDETVRLWAAKTGASKHTLKGHGDWVIAVAFSPDGTMLASASYDKTVRLWDSNTGALKHILEGHSDKLSRVAFLPNGTTLASASADGTVRLWDAKTGALKHTLKGPSGGVTAIALSPDSTTIAFATHNDKKVWLWDAKSGALKYTLKGHSDLVLALAFSPDGTTLASTSHDETARLWDAKTGAPKHTLRGHSSFVTHIAFSPSNTT